jgi:hypothetical protein
VVLPSLIYAQSSELIAATRLAIHLKGLNRRTGRINAGQRQLMTFTSEDGTTKCEHDQESWVLFVDL